MLLKAQQGFRGQLIDLDTGKLVPKVIQFDSERQEIEAYQVGADGKLKTDVNGNLLTYRAKGRFRFLPRVRHGGTRATTHLLGATQCVKCGNGLTLPGNELCAFCNGRDRGIKFHIEPLKVPLFDHRCCAKGCSRIANYSVGDEIMASPQKARGRLWGRAVVVARRFYCAFHWQPPRLLDAKGEVVEKFEDLGNARPQ